MIRRAQMSDLPELRRIYDAAKQYMDSTGNTTQWAKGHPSNEILADCINKGILYVLEADGSIRAAISFSIGEDPTYAYIEDGSWLNDAPYITLHRMASDGSRHRVFETFLRYCERLAADTEVYSLRADTHADNKTMQHLLEKHAFKKCGRIYLLDGSPRIAYQKLLPSPGRFACPCCGSTVLSEPGSYEICSICGWEDDPFQSRNPDSEGGANAKSLNAARAEYKNNSSASL